MQRMIDSEVIRSDDFIELSHSAQALYFQLVMEADNFGFVKGIKRIIMSIGATDNALTELEKSRFVLRFDNGVFVLRHWMIANGHFKNDRAYPSSYPRELAKIILLEDLTYEICLDSSWIPDGFQMDSKRIPSKSNTISNPRQRHIINIINKAISTLRDKETDDDSAEQSGDCSAPPPRPDPVAYQDGKISMTLREYLSKIPWVTNRTWEMIQRFRGKMSDSLIRFAFDQTCEHGADFPDQYTLHILEDYAAKGFKTEADAEDHENWRAEHLEQ